MTAKKIVFEATIDGFAWDPYRALKITLVDRVIISGNLPPNIGRYRVTLEQIPAPSTSELRPCPFCGGSAAIAHHWLADAIDYYVVCQGCGAPTARKATAEQAIDAWNRRVE